MVVKQFGNVNQNKQVGEKGFNKNLYVGIAIIIGLALVAAFVYSNIPLAKTVTNTGTTADTTVTTMNTGAATSSQNAVTNGQETGSLLDQVKAALAPGAKIVYGNYGDGGSYGPYVCYCTEQNGQEIPDQRGFFTLQEYLSYLERVASSGAATSSQVSQNQETGVMVDNLPIKPGGWYPIQHEVVKFTIEKWGGTVIWMGIQPQDSNYDNSMGASIYKDGSPVHFQQNQYLAVRINFKVKGEDRIYQSGIFAFEDTESRYGHVSNPKQDQIVAKAAAPYPVKHGWIQAIIGKSVDEQNILWQPEFGTWTVNGAELPESPVVDVK